MVLVSEVQHQIGRLMSQEIAEFEAVMREASIVLSDTYGIEARAIRQVLVDEWRKHRAARRDALQDVAQDGQLTDAERAADI